VLPGATLDQAAKRAAEPNRVMSMPCSAIIVAATAQ
jgi:hypothetical protein